jgi:serine phosphatase RsbU (regulator of sigma subunit)
MCHDGDLDRWNRTDRRALIAGAILLVALTVVYPIFADGAARPLGVFVLPCLLTAVLGGWRPTVLIGAASMLVAIILGVAGPLDTEALIARWLVVAGGTVIGAVAATTREQQESRVADLSEAIALRQAFERALAPEPVAPPGFVAVAHYRVAAAQMLIGGDFLEAVPLADRRLAVLIGDICGHGPREAAFGAALRAGWKSIALGGKSDPAEWVEALDAAFFRDGRIDTYATLCTGYLDREERVTRLVNLGHPPPVLRSGSWHALDLPPEPPLGLGLTDTWTAIDLAWAGEPLLFYTDGLIESPRNEGSAERWGTEGLLTWLDAHPPAITAAGLSDLVDEATAGRDVRDDIAVLLVTADSTSAPDVS